MHAVVLHGGVRSDVELEAVHTRLLAAMHAAGWSVESIRVEEQKVHPCVGCFNCWLKTPGECGFDDDGRAILRAMVQSDVNVYLTPISFGGYSGLLKTAVDRRVPGISPLFQKVHGEMHHQLRYPNPSSFLAVGWQRTPDAGSAEIFTQLVERNAINTHAPAHGSLVLSSGHTVAEQCAMLADLLRKVEVY